MHQKIVLIDQDWAIVGSSNFDQRATELNFETNLIISHCPAMLSQLEQMLEADFAKSLPMHSAAAASIPIWQRLRGQFASIFAPLL